MFMLEDKIKLLLDKKGRKMKDLCDYVGITDSGMRKIYKRDSCELSVLKKISAFFEVKTSFFFEEGDYSAMADNNSIAVAGNENHINNETEKFLTVIQYQSNQLTKSQEQIDRLLSIIENSR